MKILIIISSKYPNDILLKCIQELYKFQIDNDNINEYKICIIDSDSDNNKLYHIIAREYPNIDIHIVKNKNYEYGAWKKGYELYPNFDVYFCLQDSIIITQFIDISYINDITAYIWKDYSGYFSHPVIKNRGLEILKNTNLDYEPIVDTHFSLAYGSIFIASNNILNDMLDTLINLPTDKMGSCCYERNVGIYFICKKINTIDIKNNLIKYHIDRK